MSHHRYCCTSSSGVWPVHCPREVGAPGEESLYFGTTPLVQRRENCSNVQCKCFLRVLGSRCVVPSAGTMYRSPSCYLSVNPGTNIWLHICHLSCCLPSIYSSMVRRLSFRTCPSVRSSCGGRRILDGVDHKRIHQLLSVRLMNGPGRRGVM